MDFYRAHILVCTGTGCSATGSAGLIDEFNKQLQAAGLDKEVRVVKTGCLGLCNVGPNVVVYPEGVYYCHVSPENVKEIVEEHLLKGRPVAHLLYSDDESTGKATNLTETPFYQDQVRIALRNCGIINPEDIDEYIAYDGYAALAKVLTEMTPQDVIDEIKASGLKGRGGAGFPTGMKWQFAANSPGPVKYACCNADEGDPGAFMDRSVLEGDPHSVLEAMTIAGYAIGATQGYIYVRAEYPIAVERLQHALKQSHEYGFLGENIFGTGFSFDIGIRLGSGAFVCGEETALMVSIEGKRGEPRNRPPYPAVKGLFGKPTILNNVETYANVCWIINHGAEAYAKLGTEGSAGTKVFALGGKINNTGLVEIPMGTPLRQIIEKIGGGVPNGKKFKAVQTGGPSGACIPASQIDVPIDYQNLTAIGAMMGSGGMIVLDEDDCMVDIAKFFLQFTVDESCGKCSPCRIGTKPWRRSPPATARWRTWTPWRSWPLTSRPTPCAAWARRLPTPCSPPCGTSGTSTRPTWWKSAAPPESAGPCSSTPLIPKSVRAARPVLACARWRPSPAWYGPPSRSTSPSASSAALAWRSASSAQFPRVKEA